MLPVSGPAVRAQMALHLSTAWCSLRSFWQCVIRAAGLRRRARVSGRGYLCALSAYDSAKGRNCSASSSFGRSTAGTQA